MDIAVHIPIYYIEERTIYIHKILNSLSKIKHNIQVFIYSNENFDLCYNCNNIQVQLIKLKVLNHKRRFVWRFDKSRRMSLDKLPILLKTYIDPYYLTWANRMYVVKYVNLFDVQIYLEDDIGFTKKTFDYWLYHKDFGIDNDYNIGFLRFEIDETNKMQYYTDLYKIPKKIIKISNKLFLLNDINPYCGFWIYDKNELKKFINSREWRFKIDKYETREKSAIGWNSKKMKRYKGTIIPLKRIKEKTYTIDDACTVHHYSNNYINNPNFSLVQFPIKLNIE